MRWTGLLAFVLLLLGITASHAQENPLLGTWESRDPASTQVLSMTITDTQIAIEGEGPPVGYQWQADGNMYYVQVEDPNAPPVTFTVIDANTLELRFPDAPPLTLTRVGDAPPSTGTAKSTTPQDADTGMPAAGDESIASLLMPHGVDTRFEPAGASLEQMLNDGWEVQQASGAQGGMTLLLRDGSQYVFCMLVPKDLGGTGSVALSDCRKLN
jgi:hypothetical protein